MPLTSDNQNPLSGLLLINPKKSNSWPLDNELNLTVVAKAALKVVTLYLAQAIHMQAGNLQQRLGYAKKALPSSLL